MPYLVSIEEDKKHIFYREIKKCKLIKKEKGRRRETLYTMLCYKKNDFDSWFL